MRYKQKNNLKYAVHPGIILKDYLNTIKMTQKELSQKMNVGATVVNEIIKGKRTLTLNTAIKLETVLGLPADFWDNLQRNFLEKKKKMQNNSEIEIFDDIELDTKHYKDFISALNRSIDNRAVLLAV